MLCKDYVLMLITLITAFLVAKAYESEKEM